MQVLAVLLLSNAFTFAQNKPAGEQPKQEVGLGRGMMTLVDALRQALRDHGVVAPTIEVQEVKAIPRGAAGKAPLIRANKSSGIQAHH